MKYVALALLVTVNSHAAISLRFSDVTNSLTNLSTSVGVTGTNGLAWGIVIDTAGDNFTAPLVATAGLKVEDGANFGNGYTFFYGGVTVQQVASFDAGPGAVIVSESIDPYSSPGVALNQNFAVMWFDAGLDLGDDLTIGDNYGLLENANYLLPADGSSNFSFAAESAGVDPVRNANLSLIPEPSTGLLAILGAFGLLRRRR
ncbi:MAG: PEP-CTERM sorting domain-containing protein [Verrucomicrobiota bacterium]